MIRPPNKWNYISIDLEIDGIVVDTRITSQFTFEKTYNRLLREGQTQMLPWSIFISRHYFKKPTVIDYRDRDSKGRFIKTQPIESL